MFNTLIAIVLAVTAIFGGAVTTVYASQGSLPDQALYPVKIWTENTLMALAGSPQGQLDYALDFSDRRIAELSRLVTEGGIIPEQVVTRLQSELDQALDLAIGMNDTLMLQQMEQIRLRAETQLHAMNALISMTPESAQHNLLQVRTRLQEQVQLCEFGQTDPEGFRLQIHLRQKVQEGSGVENPGPGNEYAKPHRNDRSKVRMAMVQDQEMDSRTPMAHLR